MTQSTLNQKQGKLINQLGEERSAMKALMKEKATIAAAYGKTIEYRVSQPRLSHQIILKRALDNPAILYSEPDPKQH